MKKSRVKAVTSFILFLSFFILCFQIHAKTFSEKYSFPEYDDVRNYFRNGKYNSALKLLLTTDDSYKNPLWYNAITYIYLRLGRNDDALSMSNTALSKYPDEGWLYYAAADVDMENGNYQKGLELVNKGIKLVKKDKNLKSWLINNKAQLNYRLGKYSKSKKIFRNLIKRNPFDVSFILNSMETEAIFGNYKKCLKKYETARIIGVSEYGEKTGIQFLSYAAYYANKLRKAKKYFKQIISNNAFLQMGRTYGELSLLLNYKVSVVISKLEKNNFFKIDKTIQIFHAGLKAIKGNDSFLNDLIQNYESLTIPEKTSLSLVLNRLKRSEGLSITEELYLLFPNNPYYNYLYAYSLKVSGDISYKKYLKYATNKLPDNKLFKSLKKTNLPSKFLLTD